MRAALDHLRRFFAWAAGGSDARAPRSEQVLRDVLHYAMPAAAGPLLGGAPAFALTLWIVARQFPGLRAPDAAEREDAGLDIGFTLAGGATGLGAVALAPLDAVLWAPLGPAGAWAFAGAAVVAYGAWMSRGRPE